MIDLTRSVQNWSFVFLAYRFGWKLTWFLVQYLPKPFSFLRVFVLRMFGAKIGKRCLVMPGVKILLPNRLILGDCVAIGSSVEIYNFGAVIIGGMTVISQYAYICTAGHDYRISNMPLIWSEISIEKYCWIGARVFVGPGTNIGEGAVIGANSVVVKNIPSMVVAVGNPCVVIKPRVMIGH